MREALPLDSDRSDGFFQPGSADRPGRTNGHEIPESGGSSPEDPDVEFMLRAREGDAEAFRELFLRHSEPMLHFARRYVRNRARAEELVQEAFLQIWRARKTYEPRARFVTFAYRVVVNLCLNELRRFEYQGRTESFDVSPFEDNDRGRELPDTRIPGGEDAAIGSQLGHRIQAALDALPENQRTALLLTRVEGLSQQEVAEILESSVSAVKSLVFRGMRSLREEIQDVLES